MRFILNCQLMLVVLFLLNQNAKGQRTSLDTVLRSNLRNFRAIFLNVMGRSGDDPYNLEMSHRRGKTQKMDRVARSLMKFCDAKNGPGKRSAEPPTSVHRLRPGDIDIIGAMGDSLTAGNGIFANNILHAIQENRGASWSIGGQGTWQQYLTLPNILKEFNPDLYGYALRDGLSTERSSRFNVAELGAMSRDMPYMAKILVKRMKHDSHVNMTHHWKLVTLLIGNNDFCSDACFHPNPMKVIELHEQNMLKTYRYLRDNVPRLMLNVVPAPNLLLLTRLKGLPPQCYTTLRFECPCIIGKSKQQMEFMGKLMDKWVQKDMEIVNREEFNTETFTINIEHFTKNFIFPTLPNGNTDVSYTSEDCFHISQRGHAASTNSYWNNLFEKHNEKSPFSPKLYSKFLCPTEQRPFIMTRVNSRDDFQI
ncbi:phospholipase B1, membrane-associated [Calliphora vicina]|uniref:phospholipase B1, membrane-associated n=1 Tax=Calliphora vicina TaxID=7373 RepID=UPI00325A65D1